MSEPTYTVAWRREGEHEVMACSGLTLRTAFARLKRALRSSQAGVVVYDVRRDN